MPTRLAGSRVARFAMVLADLAWWFGLLTAAVLIGLMLSSPLLVGSDGFTPTVEVPVSIPDAAAARLMPLTSPDTVLAADPVLKDVSATLEVRTAEWWFMVLGGVVVLPAIAAVLFGLHLLRSFLADVRDGAVFTPRNARRLFRLGWLLVVAGIAWPLLRFLYVEFAVRRSGLAGVPLATGVRFPEAVLAGVLVLVLAAAWSYGVELQRDSDLTV